MATADTIEMTDVTMPTIPLLPGPGVQEAVVMDTITVEYSGLDQQLFDEKYGRIPDEPITIPSVVDKLQQKCKCSGSCLKSFVRLHVPVVDMFMTYRFREYILGDIIAGISLAILQVPQGMGYALLATLPPIIGLYTSFFPVLVYFIFGRSRRVSIGTMALTSLILASSMAKVIPQFIIENNLDTNKDSNVTTNGTVTYDQTTDLNNPIVQEKLKIAMSVSLMSGIFLVGMSMMKLGILASYISDPFMSGYISGCNIQVLTHQIKHMLGITVSNYSGPLSYFYMLRDIILNLKNTNIATLVTSIIATVILFVVKKFVNERFHKKLKVPIPIDIIVVVIATVISHFCQFEERFDVRIVKKIPQGLPQPALPEAKYMGMFIMDAFILGLVNYVLMFIMIKMFSQKYNYPYDTNQEMFATGLAGIFGSFFSSMAGSTSPPRCILGDSAGGKTQLAHLLSASLILLTLLFLAPLLQSLPICILAALILVSCIPLFVYYKACVLYWRTSKHDLAVWIVSLGATMFIGVDIGILIGVGFSMLVVVMRTQKPYASTLGLSSTDNTLLDLSKYTNKCTLNQSIRIFKFEAPLYFATLDLFKDKLFASTVKPSDLKRLQKYSRDVKCNGKSCDGAEINQDDAQLNENVQMIENTERNPQLNIQTIILDCASISFIDTSGGRILGELHSKYEDVNIKFIIAAANETARLTIRHIRECEGLSIYPSVYSAIVSHQRTAQEGRKSKE